MDSYIFDRIMIDARRVIELSKQQMALEHPGLQGRYRELLVDGALEPWLPATVQCATGTVVSYKNHFRSKTQEDVLLIDQSISPSVLIKPGTQEGVYMRNSVLARIEVKSTVEKTLMDDFIKACAEYRGLKIDLDEKRFTAAKISIMELNMLFSFKSNSRNADTVFSWFKSENNGAISAVCVLNHGFWRLDKNMKWLKYKCQTKDLEAERLAAFVGLMSNTAFDQHIQAQGRDRLRSLESGVGQYFNNWETVPAS